MSYEWFKEGILIMGTSESLALEDLKTTDAGAYSVTLTSGGGSVVSEVAKLTILLVKDAPEVEN